MSDTKVTVRERIVITLVVFLIQMLKPWQYDHQFKEFWKEIKDSMNQTPNA